MKIIIQLSQVIIMTLLICQQNVRAAEPETCPMAPISRGTAEAIPTASPIITRRKETQVIPRFNSAHCLSVRPTSYPRPQYKWSTIEITIISLSAAIVVWQSYTKLKNFHKTWIAQKLNKTVTPEQSWLTEFILRAHQKYDVTPIIENSASNGIKSLKLIFHNSIEFCRCLFNITPAAWR